jgi:hypothetical protein
VRIFKLGLISFLLLFIVLFLFSLLIPSRIRISKAVNLPQKNAQIWSLVSEHQNWPQWHPAFQTEEGRGQMKGLEFKRTSLTDSLVLWQMQQPGKPPVVNGFQLHRFPGQDSVTLQWYMDFRPGWWPWQKFSSLLYEGTYGVMMEQGLTNIKTALN